MKNSEMIALRMRDGLEGMGKFDLMQIHKAHFHDSEKVKFFKERAELAVAFISQYVLLLLSDFEAIVLKIEHIISSGNPPIPFDDPSLSAMPKKAKTNEWKLRSES